MKIVGLQMFNNIGQNFSNIATTQGLKKNLEEKMQEKKRIYGFIGMEVSDLCKSGKLAVPELDIYFAQLTELEQEIDELEKKLAVVRQKTAGSRCTCGYNLKPGLKFCPQCGKPVENEALQCNCGKKIEKGVQFCPNCGKKVAELMAQAENMQHGTPQQDADVWSQPALNEPVQEKVCICGAKVPAGQDMCMACGRLIW